MRILAAGDIHITKHKPKNRIDNYYQTVLGKFRQILDIADSEECSFVILPGDVFDTFKEGHGVVQDVMEIIDTHNVEVLAIAGQHDMKFHNENLDGTALQTLIKSEYITLLTHMPYLVADTAGTRIELYGAGWKEEIPEIVNPHAVNILVTHRMIIDEKLWAEQEGHTWANHLLMKTKFDLIVSGDNHKKFYAQVGNRYLVNLGSMMRSTIAQINHQPGVAIYDTKTKSVTFKLLDVAPIEEVICIEKAEKEKERKESNAAFIESIKGEIGSSNIILAYVDSVDDYLTKHNDDPEVADIIHECFIE